MGKPGKRHRKLRRERRKISEFVRYLKDIQDQNKLNQPLQRISSDIVFFKDTYQFLN